MRGHDLEGFLEGGVGLRRLGGGTFGEGLVELGEEVRFRTPGQAEEVET